MTAVYYVLQVMQHLFSSVVGVLGGVGVMAAGSAMAQQTPSAALTGIKAYPADSKNFKAFSLAKPPLLPIPQQLEWQDATKTLTAVSFSFPQGPELAWMKEIRSYVNGFGVNSGKGYEIKFVLEKSQDAAASEEKYSLKAGKDGCVISASSMHGLFNGAQTLRQLIVSREGKTTLALCNIIDWPSVKLRGFMQDYGRNYLPMKDIFEIVDILAKYKVNVFHFHCTDNYGWRLESKIHPKVNDPASFERLPGKFYTQEEFKALVKYCKDRHITVIPELDMPGHTKSFRKALDVKTMNDPEVTKILVDLIKELASLAPAEDMPYIHIGTDEVREASEKISQETLKAYFAAVEAEGRTAIRWDRGMGIKGDEKTLHHMWANFNLNRPPKNAPYIDSQDNYLNHLDPFEVPMTFFFRKPGGKEAKPNMIGAFLCSWPDLYIDQPRKHISYNPIYPAIVAFSEGVWSNKRKESKLQYHSNLPVQGDADLEEFREFENRYVAHRDRYFVGKEFPYVRQSDIVWKVLGPIPNGGKTAEPLAPDQGELQPSYTIDGKDYSWSSADYTGATIIFKHYCNYPTHFNGQKVAAPPANTTYYARTYIYSPSKQEVPFWISAHFWPTSDWREGAVSVPGKWFHADTTFRVNGKLIEPPKWQVPNRNKNDKMQPMVDENYHFRAPTPVQLEKGWNEVLIKAPNNGGATRRWMFTFVPVKQNGKGLNIGMSEFEGLKFATEKPANN